MSDGVVLLVGLIFLVVLAVQRQSAQRAESELLALQQAVLRLASAEGHTDEWLREREAVAGLLRQRNTYSTWSLALVAVRSEALLYGANGRVTPSALGVTDSSLPRFLKSLDLGGAAQRVITSHLESGDLKAARAVLVKNKNGDAKIKNGDANRGYILTGGTLEMRVANAATLRKTFPRMTFAVISPEDEGRLTLRASAVELRRLLTSSSGRLSHALLIAKGSTDLHFAWLDMEGGIAGLAGQAASLVHRRTKNAPSDARALFDEFMHRGCNRALRAACAASRCAVAFAGSSVHALGGPAVAASGHYFRRLSHADAEKTDGSRAHFERYLMLDSEQSGNRFFVGAIGPVKAPH